LIRESRVKILPNLLTIIRRASKLIARHTLLVTTLLMIGALLYCLLAWSSRPASGPELVRPTARRTLVIAHRGGAALWPENTLYAFTHARDLGVDVLETDVQVTADGVLVCLHDSTLDRTTDGTGAVNRLSLAQLKKLDAAFRFSTDGGRSFPLRGRGITVPTLQEVFTALPGMRLNIEPKQAQPSLVQPLCRMIRENAMEKKVMVGSFSPQVLAEFREACPEVATSASPIEVAALMAMSTGGPDVARNLAAQAVQVPEQVGGRPLLTRAFIEAAHTRNLQIHAWTINDEESMKRLIALDVDGIITDYPDRLIKLLQRKE
jgi:glycerophosphoryl diester phosphodiesterase